MWYFKTRSNVINGLCQPLNGYYLGALLFYNPKDLDCIGVLSFLRSVHAFFGFFTSVKSQIRVCLRRGFFQTTFKVESENGV